MSMSSRDFILKVIEMYKSNPCLWQVKHPDYHDRFKRNAAMNVLLAFYKTRDPGVNIYTVKKKITSMRNCFKKEFNKVKASNISGASDIHVPKLWYYNKLLFLADRNVPRSSKSNSILNDMSFDDSGEIKDENEDTPSMNVISPLSESSVASTSRITIRKTKSLADNILVKIAKELEERNPLRQKLQYDSFGEHIAEKLRNMPTIMAIYCQKIINDAIFMAETNNLTADSHIINQPKS